MPGEYTQGSYGNSTSGGRRILRKHFISVWNLLALLVVVIGGGLTYAAGEVYLESWVASGVKFPVGRRHVLALPAGPVLLYYESAVGTPTDVHLLLLDSYGERLPLRVPLVRSRTSFACRGRYFRALNAADVPEPGNYEIRCHNLSVGSDSLVPAGDRISLLKSPSLHDDAVDTRRMIHVAGGTVTVLPVIGLYVLHGLALARRHVSVSGSADGHAASSAL